MTEGGTDEAGVFRQVSRIDDSRLEELFCREVLEFIARVVSHIPDKGQVMLRYYSLYAHAHRGKIRKTGKAGSSLRIVEEDVRRLPSKGWAEGCPLKRKFL